MSRLLPVVLFLALVSVVPVGVQAQSFKVWVEVEPSVHTFLGASVYLVDNEHKALYSLGEYSTVMEKSKQQTQPRPLYPKDRSEPLGELDLDALGVAVSCWFGGVGCSDDRTMRTLLQVLEMDDEVRARVLGNVCPTLTMFGNVPVHVTECRVERTENTLTFKFTHYGITVRIVKSELKVQVTDYGRDWLLLHVEPPSSGKLSIEENGETLAFHTLTSDGTLSGPYTVLEVEEGRPLDLVVKDLEPGEKSALDVVLEDDLGITVRKRVEYALPLVNIESLTVEPGNPLRVKLRLSVKNTMVKRITVRVVDCTTGGVLTERAFDVGLSEGEHELEYSIETPNTTDPLAVFAAIEYDHGTTLEGEKFEPVETPAQDFTTIVPSTGTPEVMLDVETPERAHLGLPVEMTVHVRLGRIPLSTGEIRVTTEDGKTLARTTVSNGEARMLILPTHTGDVELHIEYYLGSRKLAERELTLHVSNEFHGFTADIVSPGNLGSLGYDLRGSYIPERKYPAKDEPMLYIYRTWWDEYYPFLVQPADRPNALLANGLKITLPEPADTVYMLTLPVRVHYPIRVTIEDSSGERVTRKLWWLNWDWQWWWDHGWSVYHLRLTARDLGLKDITELEFDVPNGLLWILALTYRSGDAYKALIEPGKGVTLYREPGPVEIELEGWPAGSDHEVVWRKVGDEWIPFYLCPKDHPNALPADHLLLHIPHDADRAYILLYAREDTTAEYGILTLKTTVPLELPWKSNVPRSDDFDHLAVLEIPCKPSSLARSRGRVLLVNAPNAYVIAITYHLGDKYEAHAPDGEKITLTSKDLPHYHNANILRETIDSEEHGLPPELWHEGVAYHWLPVPGTVLHVQIPFYLAPKDAENAIKVENDLKIQLPEGTKAVYLLYIATDQRDPKDRPASKYHLEITLDDGRTVQAIVLLPDYLALTRDPSTALLAMDYARTNPTGLILITQRPAWHLPVLLKDDQPEEAHAYAWVLTIATGEEHTIRELTLHPPETGRLYLLAITAQAKDARLYAVLGPGQWVELSPPGEVWHGHTVDVVHPGETREQLPIEAWHRRVLVKTPDEAIPLLLARPDGPNATPIATRESTLNIILPKPADAVYLLYLATDYEEASTPPTLPLLALLDDGKLTGTLVRIAPADRKPSDLLPALAWAEPLVEEGEDLTVRQAPVITWDRVYKPTGTVVLEGRTAWLLELKPEHGRIKALTFLPTDTRLTVYLLAVTLRIGDYYYALEGGKTIRPLDAGEADTTIETAWKPERAPELPRTFSWPGFSVDPAEKPYDYRHHVRVLEDEVVITLGDEPVPVRLTGRLAPVVRREVELPEPADAVYLLYLTGHAPSTSPARLLVEYEDGGRALVLVNLASEVGLYESPARTVSAWVRPVLGWHNGAPTVVQQPALELERDDGKRVRAWFLKVQAPPGQRIKKLVLLDRPPRARAWLLGLTYRVGSEYYALLEPGKGELLDELKVRVKLGDQAIDLTEPSLLLIHTTREDLEYSIIDLRNPVLPPEWKRAPPVSEVTVEYGPRILRTVKLEGESYLAVLCLPPGFEYSPEDFTKWAQALAELKDRVKQDEKDEKLALVVLTSSLPILEAYYYDQVISKLCEDYKASWVRILPGVIIAQVTIEKRSDNKVRLGLSLDTPTVLLGVEFYADPVTQRALNTRASILTQVIENYVVSKITGEPYYSEEEWALLPDNVRQDLEKILKELGVEPHGETNKQSSIQELIEGEIPEYNPTTGTIEIEVEKKKGVAGVALWLISTWLSLIDVASSPPHEWWEWFLLGLSMGVIGWLGTIHIGFAIISIGISIFIIWYEYREYGSTPSPFGWASLAISIGSTIKDIMKML
ncbi:hypothetical protein [Methanopyrus kandleri]|uniref:Uncharacterized secreted protein specific for M.kandleri with repeats, MK-5 family n=2 Tax=Methanopyrus kandleri TaxID=2320 RepID=Q8TW87_METKA|nr:hypothetical protein [Methanopyrus kandleri]AAM02362.1 Uncharacterized secreted protein specific for M.kandleri with repeats, MK-5 family [Methanopyrus kandleri AV19]HII69787.1 hypothetical protein [Methanopyrus kandleri]